MIRLVAGFELPVARSNVKRFCILYSLFSILSFSAVRGQEIRVRGKFSSDSVKIGKPIEFYLSTHYPEKLTLLFPDSTFSFAPFELQKKRFVPTKTENGISRDSVIYVLATYEVDSIQTLKLPVFVVNAMDCTQVFSNTDTVFFQNLVKAIPDSLTAEKLPLKTNTEYLGVRWQLNYVLVGIIGGILIVALITVWILFGKGIKKYFRLKRLAKGYEAFLAKFDASIQRLESGFSPQQAEATLVIWKNYLESLKARPYTKYTSKEIRAIENSEKLGNALGEIDRMIYGHARENVRPPFVNLKEFVHQQFEKKKSEVVHG
jgi:hypothetical protein